MTTCIWITIDLSTPSSTQDMSMHNHRYVQTVHITHCVLHYWSTSPWEKLRTRWTGQFVFSELFINNIPTTLPIVVCGLSQVVLVKLLRNTVAHPSSSYQACWFQTSQTSQSSASLSEEWHITAAAYYGCTYFKAGTTWGREGGGNPQSSKKREDAVKNPWQWNHCLFVVRGTGYTWCWNPQGWKDTNQLMAID